MEIPNQISGGGGGGSVVIEIPAATEIAGVDTAPAKVCDDDPRAQPLRDREWVSQLPPGPPPTLHLRPSERGLPLHVLRHHHLRRDCSMDAVARCYRSCVPHVDIVDPRVFLRRTVDYSLVRTASRCLLGYHLPRLLCCLGGLRVHAPDWYRQWDLDRVSRHVLRCWDARVRRRGVSSPSWYRAMP
ncbi:hypothetical protein EE612_053681 [Oryza sativa]|nr:hypothetical protein EE612_053681 [Oryza sativa]